MAAGNPLGVAAPAGERLAGGTHAASALLVDAGSQQALVPIAKPGDAGEETEFSAQLARLPVELNVVVPVREFRVRHLLALRPGALIESRWAHDVDVPLEAGDVQLAWSEFEVVETRLAVRITRLA